MCLRESLEFPKEVKPLVVDDVKRRMAMEPMQGKWASSRVDLGYTELFCVPEVTSVFFSFCNICSWGLSGVSSSKLRLLTFFIGNTELL